MRNNAGKIWPERLDKTREKRSNIRMKTLISLCLLMILSPAFGQTFMAKESEAVLSFQGTLLTKGVNKKSAVTIRGTQTSQDLLVVMEVKQFIFPDSYQQDEFNETFMESMYFPQIRMSGSLKDKIDLTKDGITIVMLPMKVTIRQISQIVILKVRIEIKGQEAKVSFDNILTLSDYLIPYAGEGTEIGKEAVLSMKAVLNKVN